MTPTTIYFKGKNKPVERTISTSDSYDYYFAALAQGCPHDEAANFQGWTELAGPGEVYDCIGFYAEVL